MVRYRVRTGYGKSIPYGAGFCIDDDYNEIADFQAKAIVRMAAYGKNKLITSTP
jgi:hypothetical protein